MPATPKLPIKSTAAVLLVFAVVETFVREDQEHMGWLLVLTVLAVGTFLLLPRAPALILALVLAELMLARDSPYIDRLGTALGLLLPLAAAFVAMALVPARRRWVVVALIAAHLLWRGKLVGWELVYVYSDTALFALALFVGARLQRRHEQLAVVLAERDRLVAALATGPGDAATAELLRMWSLLEQRIEPVVEALPALVERARTAPHERTAAAVEAVRARAADALAEMQVTIGGLGEQDPPPPVAADAAPPHQGRSVPAVWLACGLLIVAAVLEMLVAHTFDVYVVVFALIPLLSPRAPVLASLLLAVVVIVCSLDGHIPVAARLADFSAIVILLVAGTTASPARAAVSLALVVIGMLLSQALDPTTDWPLEAFIGSALIYVGHWLFGVLLRDVAAEQRAVGSSLEDAAEALRALQERAVRRERVRLAHELHDLVGHALTAVAIQAGVVTAQLKTGRVPAFDGLASAARQGATELARLATVLGHETDLAAELERVTDTARATGQQVELELHEPAVELHPDVRHTVVCVAAEALTNAAKHAAGAAVSVRLHARPDRLELAVIDSGGATRDLPGGGHGTASMAQRVKACGGTFKSGPRPDGGWTVQAVLPLSV